MRRNKIRNQVSDSVEYGFDRLHRIADRCVVVYPMAAVEGAVQGVARGVYNMLTHKHPLDRPTGDPGKCRCKSKPPGPSYEQPVGPYGYYGCPPPPPAFPPPPPSAPPQFQYHPAVPVPCRPPF